MNALDGSNLNSLAATLRVDVEGFDLWPGRGPLLDSVWFGSESAHGLLETDIDLSCALLDNSGTGVPRLLGFVSMSDKSGFATLRIPSFDSEALSSLSWNGR